MKLAMVPPIQISKKVKGRTVFPYLKEGNTILCLSCDGPTTMTTMSGSYSTEYYICNDKKCARVNECEVKYNPEALKKGAYIAETLQIVRIW